MFRRIIAWGVSAGGLALGLAAAPAADNTLPARYDRVVIEPTKTSVYIGTVAMTMPVMERKNGFYESSYAAKVFPYFFCNEKGTMSIAFPDETLRRLTRGEMVEFTGQAQNSDGEERKIEGKATPDAAAGGLRGKIKVRVWVSKRVELIFNTSYRFEQ